MNNNTNKVIILKFFRLFLCLIMLITRIFSPVLIRYLNGIITSKGNMQIQFIAVGSYYGLCRYNNLIRKSASARESFVLCILTESYVDKICKIWKFETKTIKNIKENKQIWLVMLCRKFKSATCVV